MIYIYVYEQENNYWSYGHMISTKKKLLYIPLTSFNTKSKKDNNFEMNFDLAKAHTYI